MVEEEQADEYILKAFWGGWERLSSAKLNWVVLVLFRGVEAGVANHPNLNNFGIMRWFLDKAHFAGDCDLEFVERKFL